MTRRALVLGSGGVTGVAWEAGVLCALEERGLAPGVWDVVIGSSAGSFVGAWFLSGHVRALCDIQLNGDPSGAEVALKEATGKLLPDALRLGRQPGLGWMPHAWTATAGLAAVGRFALARGPRSAHELGTTLLTRRSGRAVTAADAARLGDLLMASGSDDSPRWVEYLARELGPVQDWPTPLVVTALHLASGSRATFEHRSGTPLERAIAASTAVPVVVGSVMIDGHRYGDGGSASPTNADLATGFDEVLILAPLDRGGLAAEVESLRADGAHVQVVRPGGSAAALGRGPTTLDVRRRAASARAGHADGARLDSAFVAAS